MLVFGSISLFSDMNFVVLYKIVFPDNLQLFSSIDYRNVSLHVYQTQIIYRYHFIIQAVNIFHCLVFLSHYLSQYRLVYTMRWHLQATLCVFINSYREHQSTPTTGLLIRDHHFMYYLILPALRGNNTPIINNSVSVALEGSIDVCVVSYLVVDECRLCPKGTQHSDQIEDGIFE